MSALEGLITYFSLLALGALIVFILTQIVMIRWTINRHSGPLDEDELEEENIESVESDKSEESEQTEESTEVKE